MNKKSMLLAIFLLIPFVISGQDLIINKNGKEYNCLISSIDTVRVKCLLEVSDQQLSSFILVENIESFRYQDNIYVLEGLSKQAVKEMLSRIGAEPENKVAILLDSLNKSSTSFVYTFSDRIFTGEHFEYKTPILGKPEIIIDSKTFDPYEVKFYNNRHNFYANTKELNKMGVPLFLKRTESGKINLYTAYSNGVMYVHQSGGSSGSLSPTSIKHQYYSKKYEMLKKPNYKNLRVDLSDNSESLNHLFKYKKNINRQITFGVLGGLVFFGSAIVLINSSGDGTVNQEEYKSPAGAVVGLGLGSGMLMTTFVISLSQGKHLKNAINTYNNQ